MANTFALQKRWLKGVLEESVALGRFWRLWRVFCWWEPCWYVIMYEFHPFPQVSVFASGRLWDKSLIATKKAKVRKRVLEYWGQILRRGLPLCLTLKVSFKNWSVLLITINQVKRVKMQEQLVGVDLWVSKLV